MFIQFQWNGTRFKPISAAYFPGHYYILVLVSSSSPSIGEICLFFLIEHKPQV